MNLYVGNAFHIYIWKFTSIYLCKLTGLQAEGFRRKRDWEGTILTLETRHFGCDCDSAVGGISPQTRGESLVFGETEGELMREGPGLLFGVE